MAYAFRKQEAAPSNGQPLFFSFIRQAFTYLGFHYRSQLTVTWTPTSFWPLLEQQSEHEPLKQTQESGKEAANETYSPHEETYDKQDCQS